MLSCYHSFKFLEFLQLYSIISLSDFEFRSYFPFKLSIFQSFHMVNYFVDRIHKPQDQLRHMSTDLYNPGSTVQ